MTLAVERDINPTLDFDFFLTLKALNTALVNLLTCVPSIDILQENQLQHA